MRISSISGNVGIATTHTRSHIGSALDVNTFAYHSTKGFYNRMKRRFKDDNTSFNSLLYQIRLRGWWYGALTVARTEGVAGI